MLRHPPLVMFPRHREVNYLFTGIDLGATAPFHLSELVADRDDEPTRRTTMTDTIDRRSRLQGRHLGAGPLAQRGDLQRPPHDDLEGARHVRDEERDAHRPREPARREGRGVLSMSPRSTRRTRAATPTSARPTSSTSRTTRRWSSSRPAAHVKDGDFFVDGDLTIRGVTKPVSFEFEFGGFGTDPWGNYKAGATAKTVDQPRGVRPHVERGPRDRRRARRQGRHDHPRTAGRAAAGLVSRDRRGGRCGSAPSLSCGAARQPQPVLREQDAEEDDEALRPARSS